MGFANPLALLFAGLLGVLVVLYLWERQRRRLDVPSLLLWLRLPEEPMQVQRFRPEWLFYVQAALLLGLIGGLAQPYLSGGPGEAPSRRHVLVVDVSASMQAREGRRTRFEEARELALAQVQRFGADDEVMIIAAGSRPRLALELTRDRAAVIAALQALEPLDSGTNIATAVALAKRAKEAEPERTDISLFTDMPATAVEPEDRPDVRRFAVGEASDNLAITALQVFQGPFEDPKRARAYVLVNNFSYGDAHGFLSVGLNGEVVSRSTFTIPGRANRTFPVQGFAGPGLVTAHLDVDDALPADDRAVAWVHPGRELRLLLVSDPSPLVDEITAIGRVVPELGVEVQSPSRYSPSEAPSYDVVIFHRVAPEPPATGALYIYPPVGNGVFPVIGEAGSIEILDWNDTHDVLRGLRPLPAWPLHAAHVMQPPPGSQPLLWSRHDAREVPLAFTQELGGGRIACLAFDLEAEGLLSNDNVSLLVFFLNLLSWLAPADETEPTLAASGSMVTVKGLQPNLPVRIEDPRHRVKNAPPGTTEVSLDLAGAYQISSNGTRRTVLANLFDAAESDIGRGKREVPPSVPLAAAPTGGEARRGFGWWLYAMAAALMVFEWIAWRRTA